MNYAHISKISLQRAKRWHKGGLEEWSPSDWSNATFGEAGELANVVKKIRRLDDALVQAQGPKSYTEAHAKLALEIGDTYLYADLLLQRLGMSMEQVVDDALATNTEEPPYKASVLRLSNRVGMFAGYICALTDEMLELEVNPCVTHLRGRNAIKAYIGEHVAHLVSHLEDLAKAIGTDLETCVIDTFNRVSIREDFPERLELETVQI